MIFVEIEKMILAVEIKEKKLGNRDRE